MKKSPKDDDNLSIRLLFLEAKAQGQMPVRYVFILALLVLLLVWW